MIAIPANETVAPVNDKHMFIYANKDITVTLDKDEVINLPKGDTLYINDDSRSYTISGDLNEVVAVEVRRFA